MREFTADWSKELNDYYKSLEEEEKEFYKNVWILADEMAKIKEEKRYTDLREEQRQYIILEYTTLAEHILFKEKKLFQDGWEKGYQFAINKEKK